jgi:hypothetical protein
VSRISPLENCDKPFVKQENNRDRLSPRIVLAQVGLGLSFLEAMTAAQKQLSILGATNLTRISPVCAVGLVIAAWCVGTDLARVRCELHLWIRWVAVVFLSAQSILLGAVTFHQLRLSLSAQPMTDGLLEGTLAAMLFGIWCSFVLQGGSMPYVDHDDSVAKSGSAAEVNCG